MWQDVEPPTVRRVLRDNPRHIFGDQSWMVPPPTPVEAKRVPSEGLPEWACANPHSQFVNTLGRRRPLAVSVTVRLDTLLYFYYYYLVVIGKG